jgi:L-aspartate oxidase
MDSVQDVDFLVIGSGIAGLTYALETAQHGSTLVLTKKDRAESNSNYAQGGIAGVLSDGDDVRLHFEDTMVAGAGLCHPDAVEVLVTEGPERIRELMRLGARFSMEMDTSGRTVLALGREGGHSRNRIVHAVDRTGWEMERTLLSAVKECPNLEILEHYFVIDLALSGTDDARCVGAYALHSASGEIRLFRAKAVLLATGGCGQVYKHTTNPAIATGDGVAMAWRAGARVANMEFIQFHPTSLYHPAGKSFLISEAVRGEGGVLRTADGSTFMENYHPLGALAPRDIVARAIHAERMKRGEPCVYLDVTHLPADFVRSRFPTIYDRCMELALDITTQPIPVVPAAHYMCGGVQTDLVGHTSVDGLYAAGEVACTGVHGANRLASNSLLEAMVYGRRAADAAISAVAQRSLLEACPLRQVGDGPTDDEDVLAKKTLLQNVMNDYVGIVRSDHDLVQALETAKGISAWCSDALRTARPDPDLYELSNMSTVAQLIIRSGLLRKESRGLHYTTDYAQTDDLHSKHDTVLDPTAGGAEAARWA